MKNTCPDYRKRSLGGLRSIPPRTPNAPCMLGKMTIQAPTLKMLMEQLTESGEDQVVCNQRGSTRMPEANLSPSRYHQIRPSRWPQEIKRHCENGLGLVLPHNQLSQGFLINTVHVTTGALHRMTDQQMVRTIVKSVRLSPLELNLINAECQTRNIVFSEFIGATTLAKLHEQRQRKSDPIRPLRWLTALSRGHSA